MTTVALNPNVRSALAFSGTRDVMRKVGVAANPSPTPTSPPVFGRALDTRLPDIPYYKPLPSIKFAAHPAYDGPFDTVWLLTDFNDQSSNGRIDSRFLKVLRFVDGRRKAGADLPGFGWDTGARWRQKASEPGLLVPRTINDIPLRNIDYAAQSLFELSREPNQDIFVHVTDPGVGSGQKAHERSILVTEHHGVHVGPNNGTLGLLTRFLDTIGEPYHLYEIDQAKVSKLERLRPDAVALPPGKTFHGRDVFGVAAAAIAGGIDPAFLATPESVLQSLEPVQPPFGQDARLPGIGEEVSVLVNRDNTSGNLVLNVPVSPDQQDHLLAEGAIFALINPANGSTLEVPFRQTFAQVPQGNGVSYSGSKGAPDAVSYYVEAAINGGYADEALGLTRQEAASTLILKRLA